MRGGAFRVTDWPIHYGRLKYGTRVLGSDVAGLGGIPASIRGEAGYEFSAKQEPVVIGIFARDNLSMSVTITLPEELDA